VAIGFHQYNVLAAVAVLDGWPANVRTKIQPIMKSAIGRWLLASVCPAVMVIGASLIGALTTETRPPAPTDDPASSGMTCATRDEAFRPSSTYGDFVKFLDGSGQLGSSRFDAGLSGESRVQGFFAAVALEPKYMAENEAIRKSMGYQQQPKGRPALPLSGSIVLDHPGLLEAYQEVSWFASEEVAMNWINGEGGAPQEIITPDEVHLIDADDVIVRQNKPASAEYQKRIGVTIRAGRLGVGLGLQGGAEVTFSRMLPIFQKALSTASAACHAELD
jgi:hypothetical protein